MSCPDCTRAAVEPWNGFFDGCRGCAARAAARSPQYRKARDTGTQDRHYRAMLDSYAVTHADVKAAAAADVEQRS